MLLVVVMDRELGLIDDFDITDDFIKRDDDNLDGFELLDELIIKKEENNE